MPKQHKYWTIYHFEHWQQGKMVGLVSRQAESVAEAVTKLSESLKGVFLLCKIVHVTRINAGDVGRGNLGHN